MIQYPIVYQNPPVAAVISRSYPKISPKAVIGTDTMIISNITIADDVLMHVHPGHEHVEVSVVKWGVYLKGEISILHHACCQVFNVPYLSWHRSRSRLKNYLAFH